MTTRRIDRALAVFADPGPAASFLRSDGRSWREVAAQIFDVLRDPHASPETVRQAAAELKKQADAVLVRQ